MLLLLLLVVPVMARLTASRVLDVDDACACTNSGLAYNCANLNLTAIPLCVPSTATALDLSNNIFTSVNLSNFTALQNLLLSGNPLTSAALENAGISGLPSLQSLSLNNMPALTAMPNNMLPPNLTLLSWDNSPITHISDSYFADCPSLQKLSVIPLSSISDEMVKVIEPGGGCVQCADQSHSPVFASRSADQSTCESL
eukprot:m.175861 g.175861  ORF g.175861 m.175861 type:complete len:199 (-) comp53328_c0_seq2:545-1141(-)